jgi:hypothetical protein
MFLRKKAQSMAEYAVILGLVVAVAAGILSSFVRTGMRMKGAQALRYLLDAGSNTTGGGIGNASSGMMSADESWSQSQLSDVTSTSNLQRGGSQERRQTQTSTTDSIEIEKVNVTGDLYNR